MVVDVVVQWFLNTAWPFVQQVFSNIQADVQELWVFFVSGCGCRSGWPWGFRWRGPMAGIALQAMSMAGLDASYLPLLLYRMNVSPAATRTPST